MAKTTTTLAGALTASDPYVNITNKAALRAGDNVVIGTETMRVLIADPVVPAVVFRGARGTAGQAAAGGATVNYGPPSDWTAGVGVTRLVEEQEAHEALVADAREEYQKALEKKNVELKVEAEKAAAKEAAAAKAAEAAEAKAAADAEKAARR